MKLAMTLLVRDEQDIIASNLEFHLAQGVDHVIVTDNNSNDATIEILRSYESTGQVQLIQEPSDDYAQGRWVTRMARMAAVEHHADWVINSDADEFWWPIEGDLRSTLALLPPGVDAVVAHRSNFPPRPNTGLPFYEVMTVRERTSRSALGYPLPPKVCHRGNAGVVVDQGNHKVTAPGLGVGILDDGGILILHFPLRSYEQFANKIALGGAAYLRNADLPAIVGEDWRWLYELYNRGELQDYFEQQLLDEERLQRGLRDGSIIRDERLREYLTARPSAIPPVGETQPR